MKIESIGHALGTIDAGMWMMKDLTDAHERLINISPIEKMVDKATGNDIEERRQLYNNMIAVCEDIKTAKEYLQCDVSKEVAVIAMCRRGLNKLSNGM